MVSDTTFNCYNILNLGTIFCLMMKKPDQAADNDCSLGYNF